MQFTSPLVKPQCTTPPRITLSSAIYVQQRNTTWACSNNNINPSINALWAFKRTMTRITTAFFVALSLVTIHATSTVNKVKLDVYYESQCPYCRNFFVNQLRPTSKLLSKYMETNLVPYGNAKTIRNGNKVTFQCQHGESECLLTKIHACSLARVKGDNLQRVLLASCLFDYYKTPIQAGKKCSSKFGLSWSDVSACAKGSEGTALMDKYGKETNSLNPPHQYVPFVEINKYRGNDDYQNLIDTELKTVVCKVLAKENIKPAACQ
ncbi:hypothetical protein GE061_000643 [Apolygus lucorum]|uniref:Gamma-interferon-inducible lysosomal thiol reductase n=1 Tax=Apolygus lucorum TaxID=248454 RepID=A0A8S9Y558_APOLU|nr:hypothetical protein GE061_000643 [Apolygus lucorum]